MKKRIALVMAVMLALSGPAQNLVSGSMAHAALSVPDSLLTEGGGSRASWSDGEREESRTEYSEAAEREYDSSLSREAGGEGSGALCLRVQGVTEAKETEWNLELHPVDDWTVGEAITKTFILPAIKDNQYSVEEFVLRDIPNGRYDLLMFPSDMDGNSYIPYEQQDIQVKGDLTTIWLMNDLPQSHGYEGDTSGKIGVLAMGDINGDGSIDDKDKEELLNLVAAENRHDDALTDRADLNDDGQIDILDVVHFTKYYKTGADRQQAKPVKAVLVRAEDVDKATVSNAQTRSGSLPAVLAGQEALVVEADKDITKENPVKLEAEFGEPKTMRGFVIQPVTGSGGSIRNAMVEVEYANGKTGTFYITDGQTEGQRTVRMMVFDAAESMSGELGVSGKPGISRELGVSEGNGISGEAGASEKNGISEKTGTSEENGISEETNVSGESSISGEIDIFEELDISQESVMFAASQAVEDDAMLQGLPIEIDLKGQVAVKKITITITATLKSNRLVDISRVEFLNNMEDRIPEPKMSGPERLKVDDKDASFTVSWKKQSNVTGYEVTVSHEEDAQTYLVENGTSLTVSSIGNKKLINGQEYLVGVRSVNGEWRSTSSSITAHPRAASLPPAPENLTITGGFKRLIIQWKDMKDTDSYTLYYRKADDQDSPYQSVSGILENRYDLQDLEDQTKYEIYLTGTNPLGEGPASIHYTGSTVSIEPPVTPNYKLINTPVEGSHTSHVVSVAYGGTDGHEFDVVDGDYSTSWVRNDWDAGYSYPGENKSPIVTLDEEYEMDTIALIPDEQQKFNLKGVTIYYWDAQNKKSKIDAKIYRKTSNNKAYYMVQAKEPFTAKRVQISLGNAYGNERRISIAELKFYYYDSLEREIMDLYSDTYHVSLRENVAQKDIDALRTRLNTRDEVSGEYHYKMETLETELANAERILKEGSSARDIMVVDNKDTERSDGHITFRGGLNVYQPLGVTVRAGDTITVYAGGPAHNVGDGTRLELIISQYHGSSNAVFKSAGYLKAGPNEITIGQVDNMDLERGGQLYVTYTGAAGAEEYGVRVLGGTRIPTLDLSDISLRTLEDPMEDPQCSEKILSYIDALEDMRGRAQQLHQENHKDYAWEPANCVYEATDIVTRYAMLSLATERVCAGLGSGSREEKAQRLAQSLKAMDEMMYLFYQHKGLSEDPAAPSHNKVPVSRINIRYQRMFAGAFMYAGGRHIGIEWAQLSGMVNARPVQVDENGKGEKGGGKYFGWGIAHEIGHEINEGAYAVAEVTNNYFSVLAQAKDTNDTVRFKYSDVFKKVTSGTKGRASNVFVQLAMYWQLHLAYDKGYNYKIYDTNEEQLENLFFARVDSYVRKTDTAPGSLNLSSANSDNKLMRLAVAAAEKDLLDFFRHWGLEPDEGTIAYAGQFEKETRGIWFANDETRAAQIEAGAEQNLAESARIEGSVDYTEGENTVTLNLSAPQAGDDIWIYEISRYERIKDRIERRTVGYAQASGGEASFTDVIGTINNHTFTYEAVGYDRWLNPTRKVEIGSVKVSHDGTIDKSLWEVTTNMTNSELEEAGEDDPDTRYQPGTELMIDGDLSSGFTGSTEGSKVPEIILHLNQVETITGLKYTAAEGTPIGSFKIYVSETGGSGQAEWTEVKAVVSAFNLAGGSQTIYFRDTKNLYTYDASYVKIIAPGQGGKNLTVSELSLLGETGDNVCLEQTGSIGILSEDYVDGEARIPKDSLVFTGRYKGNPAYNTVLLWDENGKVVGGIDEEGTLNAAELILAPDPENGMLGEVSDGIWVYYIEPGYDTAQLAAGKVRAELYRVDNAQTQEGERLVSSTMFVEIPASIPSIKLTKSQEAAQ